MNHFSKKLTAMASAMTMALCALPTIPAATASAEDVYNVRDPFFNFSSKYHYYESEHFQFIWGDTGSDSAKVTQSFLEGNARNMEAIWNVYTYDLDMITPSESVEEYLRDGKKYKTNIYISGTGLEGMQDDWAYMSWDSGGFAYMFCCVDSMRVDPPSWVLPHEYGHVVTAHQGGWNSNKYSYAWWETIANWYREQYLYSDYSTDEEGHGTNFFVTYIRNLCFTAPLGRDYYDAWPILQYLTENPDNLEGYGKDFVKKMLTEGQRDEYPYNQIDRLAGADLKETLGRFAAHMAGLDFAHGDAYRARLEELNNDENWTWQQVYTMLEPVAGTDGTFAVPAERAPQFAGMNIVPLNNAGGDITVTLTGKAQGDDNWRGCIVQQDASGKCTYSELFTSGQTITVPAAPGAVKTYLSVIATPDLDSVTKTGLPGIMEDSSEFAESKIPFSAKTRYPYTVTLSSNISIMEREVKTGNNWWESYHQHSNGGGLVSDNAKVDASVYVAPDAKVLGNATVTGNVQVLDHAVIEGNATVSDNAVVSGYAIVAGNANVSGNALVGDCGIVTDRATVSGNGKVIENACLRDSSSAKDYGIAKGNAFIYVSGTISGEGAADGDYYDDGSKNISKGVAYGWESSNAYAAALPDTDALIYAYDFSEDSTFTAKDRYSSTYATNFGAQWEAERTSANGVLTFDGGDFLELDKSVMYADNFEFQTAVLNRDNNGGTLLYLGDDANFISLRLENGAVVYQCGENIISTGEGAVKPGEWAKIGVQVTDGQASISVNGNTVVQAQTAGIPADIVKQLNDSSSNAAYRLGADNNAENGFTGSMDFARFYFGDVAEPAETYSGTEEIVPVTTTSEITTTTETTTTTTAEVSARVWGDADDNGVISISDIVLVLQYSANKDKYPLDEKPLANCDVNADSVVDAKDAFIIQMLDANILSQENMPYTE